MSYDGQQMVIMSSPLWKETLAALKEHIRTLRDRVHVWSRRSGRPTYGFPSDVCAEIAVYNARLLHQAQFAYLHCGGTDRKYTPAGYGI